jgi:hypothetical protein
MILKEMMHQWHALTKIGVVFGINSPALSVKQNIL